MNKVISIEEKKIEELKREALVNKFISVIVLLICLIVVIFNMKYQKVMLEQEEQINSLIELVEAIKNGNC